MYSTNVSCSNGSREPASRRAMLGRSQAHVLTSAALALLLVTAGCGAALAGARAVRLPETPAEQPATRASAEPVPTAAPRPTATSGPALARDLSARQPASVPAVLRQELSRLINAREGTFGVLIEHLPTSQRYAYNADRSFDAASVYKAWLAYKVLHDVDLGRIALDDRFTIESEDVREPEPDSDVALGDVMTVQEALQAIMGASSNAAAHGLLRVVGRAELNEALAALGLRSTQVPFSAGEQAWSVAAAAAPASARTTAHDTALLFRQLATERLLTDGSRQELRRLLALGEDLDPIAPRLPAEAEVLVKLGNLEDASNAAGLIETPSGTLIVSVFDERVDPGVARAVIADLVERTYSFYLP